MSAGMLALAALFAFTSSAMADCRRDKYAVYLSPGFEPYVRWGGYHVTLTGFSANHDCGGSMEAVLRDAWHHAQGGKPFSFESKSRGKDYRAKEFEHPWGRRWGISFKSKMLTDKLAPMLRKGRFENVKSNWHISLYSSSATGAVHQFESHLKNKPWRLFLVRLPSKSCQDEAKGCINDWTLIR